MYNECQHNASTFWLLTVNNLTLYICPFSTKSYKKIRKKYFYRYQNRNFNINILKVGNRILIQTIRAPTLRRGEGVAETSEAKPE